MAALAGSIGLAVLKLAHATCYPTNVQPILYQCSLLLKRGLTKKQQVVPTQHRGVTMPLINLANLEEFELKSFLDSFDTVLCDCDGVVWHLGTPIAGVDQSVAKLRQIGKKVRFVTNNSYAGLTQLYKYLNKCNLDAELGDIANPCLAIIRYLKKIKFSRKICILGSPILKKEIKDAGFELIDLVVPNVSSENVFENPNILKELRGGIDQIGAVLFDMDFSVNYVKLTKLLICLQNPDVLFLAGFPDKTLPLGPNMTGLGSYYFYKAIQDITNREPIVFGKPAMELNELLIERFKIENPSRTLFIGDNLECDIEFASKCGYQTLLVLTGITTLENTKNETNADRIPNFYINNLADLYQLIKG